MSLGLIYVSMLEFNGDRSLCSSLLYGKQEWGLYSLLHLTCLSAIISPSQPAIPAAMV